MCEMCSQYAEQLLLPLHVQHPLSTPHRIPAIRYTIATIGEMEANGQQQEKEVDGSGSNMMAHIESIGWNFSNAGEK